MFSSVQSFSRVWLFAPPMDCNTLGLPVHHQLESVMPSNHLIVCDPLLLLPSTLPASGSFWRSQFFTAGGQKYWSFSISPSNEYSGLISFRTDCFDLLDVQGPRESLPQHHSSKASVLQCWTFFMVQLSHPYMTGETIALFVSKVMDLCQQSNVSDFHKLSRLVIAFLPRGKVF